MRRDSFNVLNNYIEESRIKLHRIYTQLEENGELITAELIKLKYDKEDLPITEVSGELVRAFEFYLKTEKNCQQNTVIRYMKCLYGIGIYRCSATRRRAYRAG